MLHAMKNTSRKPDVTVQRSGKPEKALTARGAQRREQLLKATMRIIVRDGPGAVTLRTVVAEAKASHGAIAYYFGSREDLIQETLRVVAERNIKALQTAWEDIRPHASSPQTLAKMIARHCNRQMAADSEMGITIIELHLAAARFPELRPTLIEWGRAYAQIVHDTLQTLGSRNPEADTALLINTINGHILGQLALPRRTFEATILRPALERLLTDIRDQGHAGH